MAWTLLVVEDEPSIADLLALALGAEGYRVVVVGDGRAALRRLAEGDCDLVLSDVMLPHLDGLGLARAMQADPALRTIPLVLMSAVHQPRDGVPPYAAFLPKPFALDVLLATVARLLGPEPAEEELRDADGLMPACEEVHKMSQNVPAKAGARARLREEEARLLWEDRRTDAQIAAQLGIYRRTLAN